MRSITDAVKSEDKWIELLEEIGRPISVFKAGHTVDVNDTMQIVSYQLKYDPGTNLGSATDILHPGEMLRLGIFEGKYLNDCIGELPKEWFKDAYENGSLSITKPNKNVNYFKGYQSRRPLCEWKANGWIKDHDPRGWYQWWCRYWLGRRISGYDEWQLGRRKSFVARHSAACQNHHYRRRQGLLQWGKLT